MRKLGFEFKQRSRRYLLMAGNEIRYKVLVLKSVLKNFRIGMEQTSKYA